MSGSELKPELLGLSNIINDPTMISGPRVSMNGNQAKQTQDIEDSDPLQFPTGNETEYAKYLFNDRSEHTGTVFASIARRGLGIPSPLEYTLFIRSLDIETGVEKIAIQEIKNRRKHHDVFASELEPTSEGLRAMRGGGAPVTKGMSYNQPNSYKDGEWAISASLPTAIISDHTLIEDSYTIADVAADKMLSYGYKDYIFNLKAGQTLANIWGEIGTPRYLPRIGESIRDNGKVIGLMELAREDLAIELSDYYMHDPIAYYCNIHHNDGDSTGEGKAKIVDIEVLRNDAKGTEGPNPNFMIPDTVQKELDTHAAKYREYYHKILIEHMKLCVEYGGEDKVPYTNKAKRIIYEAIAKSPQTLFDKSLVPRYRNRLDKASFSRVYAYDKIETYRIKVTVRYPIPLTVSGKISDFSGTKGIVSNIRPLEDMPIDENGVRVQVMRCCGAQLRRSTYLPIYIIYMSHVAREALRPIRDIYEKDGIEAAWPRIIELTADFNPQWAELVDEIHASAAQKEELWNEIKTTYLRVCIPNDYEKSFKEICDDLAGKYKIQKTKLQLTMQDGSKVWTSRKYFVGNIPTIRLDKHGREFSSISSPRFDPFGTIAKTTAQEASFRPCPTKANTFISESEDRLFKNHGDSSLVDEVKDRSNNPVVSEHETINVLRASQPQNMECAVDRIKYPLGNSRPLQIVQHVHRVGGVKLQKVRKNNG